MRRWKSTCTVLLCLSFFLLFFILPAPGQTDTVMTITKDTDTTLHMKDKENKSCNGKTYARVEEMPSYPGGVEKMKEFLRDTLQYPSNVDEKKEGKVYVQFSVCKDGSLTDLRILKGLGEPYDSAAMEAVRAMPEWEPGQEAGKERVVQETVPVPFEP